MRKIGLLTLLGLVFAVCSGSEAIAERSAVRRNVTSGESTQAQVVDLNTENGRATCIVYPDAQGSYPDLMDITTSGLEASSCKGGCKKGTYCGCDSNGQNCKCKPHDIILDPGDGSPLP